MNFEGVNFYPAAFEKSLEDFIKHEFHVLSKEKLIECYKIVHPDKIITPVKKHQPVNTGKADKKAN